MTAVGRPFPLALHAWSYHRDPLRADALRQLLGAGAYLWPAPQSDEERRLLDDGVVRPAAAKPGTALLVRAASDGAATVALADLDAPAYGRLEAHFSPGAKSAWAAAVAAVTDALPVLWTSVRALEHRLPAAACASRLLPGASEIREQPLDGASFGLAFCIAQASFLLELAPPANVLASAELRAGAPTGVDLLDAKLRAAARLLPNVTRFVVAKDQRDEAIGHLAWLRSNENIGHDLNIEGVDSVEETLRLLFPDLDQAMIRYIERMGGPGQVAKSLLRLTLEGRGESPHWRPIANAATIVLEATWPPDEVDRDCHQTTLQFVRAVADRHDDNAGTLPPEPDREWLKSFPESERPAIVAHWVQHALDTGTPLPDLVVPIAREFLSVRPNLRDARLLQLQGSLGRLVGVRLGRPVEGMALLLYAARWWLGTGRTESERLSASYPLAFAFVLSAGTTLSPDSNHHAAAEELFTRWATVARPARASAPWLSLSRARAQLLLFGEATTVVQDLSGLATVPSHQLRLSARRWLAAAHRIGNSPRAAAAELNELRAELDRLAPRRRGPLLHTLCRLAELDAAHTDGDEEGAARNLHKVLHSDSLAAVVAGGDSTNQIRRLRRDYPY